MRYFRHPDVPGTKIHYVCGRTFHDHGWIDSGGDGVTVCPGDWVTLDAKVVGHTARPAVKLIVNIGGTNVGTVSLDDKNLTKIASWWRDFEPSTPTYRMLRDLAELLPCLASADLDGALVSAPAITRTVSP